MLAYLPVDHGSVGNSSLFSGILRLGFFLLFDLCKSAVLLFHTELFGFQVLKMPFLEPEFVITEKQFFRTANTALLCPFFE